MAGSLQIRFLVPPVRHLNVSLDLVLQGNAQFAEKVAQWQRKLGTVDVVLNTWAEVQKKWANLESIFVGSADIRVQLPEDSKRFDAVNTDFQAWHLPSEPPPWLQWPYGARWGAELFTTRLCLRFKAEGTVGRTPQLGDTKQASHLFGVTFNYGLYVSLPDIIIAAPHAKSFMQRAAPKHV